jgi:GH43 family beta-xylosidase
MPAPASRTRAVRLAPFLLSALGFLQFGAADAAAGEEVRDFFNVIAPDGADPWVIRHEGHYYATMTTGRDVTLWRSDTLTGLGAGERKVVWEPPPRGPYSRDLWAPELHRIRGKWYVYVAADDGENANHRMYVLENDADDPLEGRFEFRGKIADPDADRWAIDGTVLDLGERLFFLWSGWEGTENVDQRLYIAPMSDPWTISGPRVELSRPTLGWETRGGPPTINEGPECLVRDGLVHLIYSASGSWTDDYCLGRLTARLDSDLLDPDSWAKHPEPVFARTEGVFGPGHCSFTKSPDGAEDWIVYHTARYRGAGWTREVRTQPFTWDADGNPRFGEPAPPDRPIPIPSGEPARERLSADGGRGAVVDQLAATTMGPHVVSIRYRNASADKADARGTVDVGGVSTGLRFPYTGPNAASCALVRVRLPQGRDAIQVGQPRAKDFVFESVDVFPDRVDRR